LSNAGGGSGGENDENDGDMGQNVSAEDIARGVALLQRMMMRGAAAPQSSSTSSSSGDGGEISLSTVDAENKVAEEQDDDKIPNL